MSSVTYTLQERNCNKVRNHSMTRKRINTYKSTDCIMQMRLLEFNKILDSLESPQIFFPFPFFFSTGMHKRWRYSGKRARPGFEPGTSRTLSENHTPRPTSQLFSLLRHSLCIREITPRDVLFPQRFLSRLAPWLSWLKRLSSKQEIPSSNLCGASFSLS